MGKRPRAPDVGALYAEHASRVFRWTLRFYPRSEAEEVVHEVFVKVIERIDGFRNDASPTTWLYRMTVNHCLNRVRDEGRRTQLWQEHAGESMWFSTPAGGGDQDAITFVRQFWRQLDDELLTVGYYYFVDGMTHAEIARVLGCSPRTVGNRLERLRTMARSAAGLAAGAGS